MYSIKVKYYNAGYQYTIILIIIYTIKTQLKFVYTSAHTLAKSLHDVSRANNNRFAVVVCFRLAFHASEMRFFLEIFVF